MSGAATIWAWQQPDLSPTQRLVLLALADQARDNGLTWAGQKHFVKKTGLSLRAIRDAMKELEARGLLRREERVGTTPLIWLCLTTITVTFDTPAPPAGGVRQQVPGGAAAGAANPSKEPREGSNEPSSLSPSGDSVVVPIWQRDPHFAEAWAALTTAMKKRSDGRDKLWPLWSEKAKRVGADKLVAALKAYVAKDEDVQRTGGPGLQVWLRAHRWDQWLDVPTGAPAKADWSGPAELWSAVVAEAGEDFARSYLLPASAEQGELGWVVRPRTTIAREKLAKLRAMDGVWLENPMSSTRC